MRERMRERHRSRERDQRDRRSLSRDRKYGGRDMRRNDDRPNRDRYGRIIRIRSRSRDRKYREYHKGKSVKQDKFKDSLSEGMKNRASSDSSDVDVDIDLNEDEDDEQVIIEKRRKQREELLKVRFLFYFR